MKKLAVLGTIFLGFNSFGQDLSAQNSGQNEILYRGFLNEIELEQTGDENQSFKIEAVNCSVTKLNNGESSNTYIVKTDNRSKTARINLISEGQTIHSYHYTVENLPAPSLFWGNNKAGSSTSNEAELLIKYLPGVKLQADFEIAGWNCTQGDIQFEGKGKLLSEEVLDHTKSMTSGESITIEVQVKGADGITRNLSGTWVRS